MDKENRKPEYFRNLMCDGISYIPVDRTCMHKDHCVKDPEDLLFDMMEHAAKNHKNKVRFTLLDVYYNLKDSKDVKKIIPTEVVKGHLWWKYPAVVNSLVEDEELGRFCYVMARNTMDELDYCLHDRKFNFEVTRDKEECKSCPEFYKHVPPDAPTSFTIYF